MEMRKVVNELDIATPRRAPIVATRAEEASIRGQLIKVLQKQLQTCESVLELGAGHFEMIGALKAPVRIGLEIHRPYIERRICDPGVVAICADATKVGELFLPKSLDGIMLIDFIEHLEKATALALLDEVEQIARSKVIVHCPAGRHPQDKDVFELGGDEYQTHRSQWEPEDFESRGYATVVIDKFFDEKDGVDPRAIIAVKRISETQLK